LQDASIDFTTVKRYFSNCIVSQNSQKMFIPYLFSPADVLPPPGVIAGFFGLVTLVIVALILLIRHFLRSRKKK